MDWTSIFTVAATFIAGIFGFYQLIDRKIDKISANHKDNLLLIREDMKQMDGRWERMYALSDSRWIQMDNKWEKLFEKYLSDMKR